MRRKTGSINIDKIEERKLLKFQKHFTATENQKELVEDELIDPSTGNSSDVFRRITQLSLK